MTQAALPAMSRTIALTAIAMIAFAANSVLCRIAIGQHAIDAASFATIRIVSGAVMLSGIMLVQGKRNLLSGANWRAALMLFAYAVFFTYAYISLSTGTGALILFGAVQLTMFVAALRGGESFSPLSWFGLGLAIAGLIYLVSPGVTAPEPAAALSMAIAGVAWGFYSLIGRGARDPLAATAGAFILCVPAMLIVELFSMNVGLDVSTRGLWLAVISGAITSGLGYVVWFAALPGLGATSAATVQLSVPAIAALGGVLFLSEALTVRLVVAAVATLGGVTIVLTQRAKAKA
jgi:drug/metabolite transporter (DMT)-like permease